MKALSIFSGCGGMDIGIEKAGFKVVGAIEKDKYASESLRDWYLSQGRSNVVVHEDIRDVDPSSFKDIDLLFGGPPCQAFSLAGKRNALRDERGQLLFEVTRFASSIRPRAVIIEQVKGLLSAADEDGQKGGVFKQLIDKLSGLGYVVKWQVLNSADYGVPQKRQRLFIVGTLGKNGFKFPNPTHSNKEKIGGLFQTPPHEGISRYLFDLPEPVRKGSEASVPNHIDVTPERDTHRISFVPEGGHLAAQRGSAPDDVVMRLSKKDTTKYRRLKFSDPSLTLRGGEIFFHPIENRYLTPREYLRIHTFPDNYKLAGPIRSRSGSAKNLDQHRQVANSVPPKLAEFIAKELIKVL
jgi:DNA (cytosine-5)-methyltransferase 1